MAAPTQLAYRTQKDVGLLQGAPIYEPVPEFERPAGNIRCCVYSPCGRYFACASPERVTVLHAQNGRGVLTLPAEHVFELGFSPLGTFLIIWQRPSKDEKGDAVKNLKVWRVADGQQTENREVGHTVVGQFVQKSATGWNLQYTHDEEFCARVVSNEVQFYKSGNLSMVWNRLRVEGVTDFAVSPGKNHAVAVFVPERKGVPASVSVFDVPKFDAPSSRKTFFKGDKVQLRWNNAGTHLIVLAQTEVDKSGKSYYGETTLYLMSGSGGFDSRIDLDKDGPIHDVTWSPNSKEFGVVYGYMPAKTTLFNTKAIATHSFPLAPRNTVLFSPHGKYVLVAGFGNLAGQMDIYDLERDHRRICTIEASNASVCEWSPDGIHILTATTSPRLRVDNGVRIWHVNGGLMYNEDLHELYHVIWRPQSTTQHPLVDPPRPMPAPHESALKYLGTVKIPSKPAGAYRPPGARGQVTPLAFRREDEGGVAYVSNGTFPQGVNVSSFGKPKKRDVPGAETINDSGPVPSPMGGDEENLSKAAAKNKKKREAKKTKETTVETGVRAPTTPTQSPEREGKKIDRPNTNGQSVPQTTQHSRQLPSARTSRPAATKQTPQNSKANNAKTQPILVTTSALAVPPLSSGGTSHEKKVRALLKKLRAIDDLKMRRAGGEKLEGTQIRKMDTEDAVRRELEESGWIDG